MLLTNRYVAFLDVLGFKDKLLSYKGENFLNSYYSQLLTNITITEESYSNHFNFVVMSDSIVIFSKDKTSRHFNEIVQICSGLQHSLLMQGIPIRGAISYGQFDSKNINDIGGNVFIVGPSLIEAYEWERKQKWLGIILCPSVERIQFDLLSKWSWKDPNEFVYNFIFKCSDIPIQDLNEELSRENGFIVFPRVRFQRDFEDETNYLSELKKLKLTARDVKIKQKYDETINFIKEIYGFYPNITEIEV